MFLTILNALVAGALPFAAPISAAPAPFAPPPPVDAKPAGGGLPPLDYDASLWNFDARWFASEWNNAFSDIPWRYDHVIRRGGDLLLRLDRSGSAQIKPGNATPRHTAGLWEADVTIAPFRSGVVQAPLWLYNDGTKDEIDFEFGGERGLFITMHTYTGGYRKHGVQIGGVRPGRHRFGIKMDQAAGYVEMIVDGRVVHRWDRATSPSFVSSPLGPIFELWAVRNDKEDFVGWLGPFAGMSGDDRMDMVLHGYRYTAL